MPVSVGEVSATLRFSIQQADIKDAQANLRDLSAQFREAGGDATDAGQRILAAMIPAQAQLDRLQADAAATRTELQELAAAGSGLENIAAGAAAGTSEMTKFEGVATRMLERLAVLYALRETFTFVEGLYTADAAIVKLSNDTGTTIETVAAWERAGEDASVPTNDLAKAIGALQLNLAEMKPAVSDTLASLNLNFKDLFALNPDDQLKAIATALEGVPSPAQRAKDEVALFGTDAIDPLIKKYSDLIPLAEKQIPSTDQIAQFAAATYQLKDFQMGAQTAATWVINLGAGFTQLIATPFFAWWAGGIPALKQASAELLGIDTGIQDITSSIKNAPPGPLMGQAFVDSLKDENDLTTEQLSLLDQLRAKHQLTLQTAVQAAGVTSGQYKEYNDQVRIALENEKKLEQASNALAKLQADNAADSARRWSDYSVDVMKQSGDTRAVQVADVQKWADSVTEAAIRGKKNTGDFYDWLTAETHVKLDAIGVDWSAINKVSFTTLQQNLENALKTYDAAFGKVPQAELQVFRDNVTKAADALHGMASASTAVGTAQQQTQAIINQSNLMFVQIGKDGTATFQSIGDAIDAMNNGLKASQINVEGLDGSVTSLADAIKKLDQGSSMTYDLSTDEGIDVFMQANPGATFQWSDAQIEKYIAGGGSLQSLIASGIINVYGKLAQQYGQAVGGMGLPTGFAEGGMVDIGVGENGPEVVRVPLSSTVFPSGTSGGGAGSITNVFYVNGSIEDLARPLMAKIAAMQKQSKLFSASLGS